MRLKMFEDFGRLYKKLVVNDDGDYLPNVWLGEVTIVLGQ